MPASIRPIILLRRPAVTSPRKIEPWNVHTMSQLGVILVAVSTRTSATTWVSSTSTT